MHTFWWVLIVLVAMFFVWGMTKSQDWKSRLRFLSILVSATASVTFLFYIIGFWKYVGITTDGFSSVYQFPIVLLFVLEYALFSTTSVCAVAWKKKGFSNLKKVKDKGLVFCLIIWLIVTPIIGLIMGLIMGTRFGSIAGLIAGFITGFVAALLIGLTDGCNEFQESKEKKNKKKK